MPATVPRDRVDLSRRETDVFELMDDPDCDLAALRATYRNFALVNRLVSGWRAVYRSRIRPLLDGAERPLTLLDIGSGGGDVPRALAAWARHDGHPLEITAIDPDPRAHEFATAHPPTPGLRFEQTTSRVLADAGSRFDLVTSNHVLHHLDRTALDGLLDDSARLAERLVVHNDIARGRVAYSAYAVATTGTFRGSFIHVDGLRSIRRSYRADELREDVPSAWQVSEQLPFRLLLTFEPRHA
jgi:2-polyprenyl-3-methyl-5-hydroxy-6-metoxy-1,4-benzoquinol methylase